MKDYSIDKDGTVIVATALPAFCAECDAAEWKISEGELTCENVKMCARLIERLADRQTRRPIATKEDGTLMVEERPEGVRAAVVIDRQQTRDRLAVDEAQAERGAAKARSVDKGHPVDWEELPHYMTAREFALCAGVSRSTVSKNFPPELLAKYGTWARLPKVKGKTKIGIMIDERALDEWKDRPQGWTHSRAAVKSYDEAITWRWARGENPLQIAKELGLSRAFVRRRVRETFGA